MPINASDTPIPTNRAVPALLETALQGPQLDIHRSPQKEDAWCYAACAQMVINFLIEDDFVEQCDVASFVKTVSCCPPTPSSCTDSGCEKSDIRRIFGNFRIDFEGAGADPEITINQITSAEIRSEISDGHPIEVVIDWNTQGLQQSSHAVLISGIRNNSVYVIDPLRGVNFNGWQPLDFLKDGFGQGNWVRTWTGLRKREI
jgi:hypothetical protein